MRIRCLLVVWVVVLVSSSRSESATQAEASCVHATVDTFAVLPIGDRPNLLHESDYHFGVNTTGNLVIHEPGSLGYPGRLLVFSKKGRMLRSYQLHEVNVIGILVVDNRAFLLHDQYLQVYELYTGAKQRIQFWDTAAGLGPAYGAYFTGRMLTLGNGEDHRGAVVYDVAREMVVLRDSNTLFVAPMDSCGDCDCQRVLAQAIDNGKNLCGLSPRYALLSTLGDIVWGENGVPKSSVRSYFVFDIRDCKIKSVRDFHPQAFGITRQGTSAFVFLNDSTAIYHVKGNRPGGSGRQCVFLRVTLG